MSFHVHVNALAGAVAATITAIVGMVPDLTGINFQNEITWLFRAVMVASLGLNLHFLRKVYNKVGHVDKVRSQISTIVIAIQYLAREAATHGGRRESDSLILNLLDDLNKQSGDIDK